MNRRNILSTLVTGGALTSLAFGNRRLSESIDALSAGDVPVTPDTDALDEDFWITVQQAFDVDRITINLNNGGVSPSPRMVQDALRRYTEEANRLPAYVMWQVQEPRIETVRESLAEMFGADREEIAITRNASESLLTAQFGIPLKAGDEVVISTQDYPRMLTAWDQRARRDGIVVKKVKIDVPIADPSAVVEAYKNAITNKTKVLHCSHVVFLTGQIMPVKEICDLARRNNLISIIDGAHAFAQFPFMHSDVGCDVYATSLHKWLCGPIGTGMLYVRKDLIPDLWPLMAAPKEMDANIRKYEEIGTHPAAVHNALIDAIAFNKAVVLERKAARFRYMHSLWIDDVKGLSNVKFLTDVTKPPNQCAMVNVHIDGIDHSKLSEWLLKEHKIFTVAIVHEEFNGLRVTPNVYTTVKEIQSFRDALLEAINGNISEIRM